MKILIVSFYYTPEIGAAPFRITNMANGLNGQNDKVDVLTALPNYPKGKIFEGYRGRLYKKENVDGIDVFRLWTYATTSKNAVKRGVSMVSFAVMIWLFSFLRKTIKAYDCVIVQTPPLLVATSAVILFKKLFHKKIVLNVSDLWPLSAVKLGAMAEKGTVYKAFCWMEKFVYKNADAIFGQSEEIIRHTGRFASTDKKEVYRNLHKHSKNIAPRMRNESFKIVYAGLLGVAQNIVDVIKAIDFREMNVEFHVYGNGNQVEDVKKFASAANGVFYHGIVDKEHIAAELLKYDASIVPLTTWIPGAVPSKIFELIPLGIPILFCGGGEGAEIIQEYGIGYVSSPGDYEQLRQNIVELQGLSNDEYSALSARCIELAKSKFDFDRQINATKELLKTI